MTSLGTDARVAIVDVGLGNVRSVANMLRRLGVEAELRPEPPPERPRAVVLPGVGSFDYGIERLSASGWFEYLERVGADGSTGILGICLGMQLLGEGSDEGVAAGLGLVPGRCTKFAPASGSERFKVPHMGWAEVAFDVNRCGFAPPAGTTSRFYFVHSYRYADVSQPSVVATADHAGPFAACVQHGRVVGVQFHPEKSHRFGMDLLANVFRFFDG